MNTPKQLELLLSRTGCGRINPKPRGSLSPFACPAQVMRAVIAQPHHWFAHSDLIPKVDKPKALPWALAYLLALGWIETGDDPRSSRYRRYRVTSAGRTDFPALGVAQ